MKLFKRTAKESDTGVDLSSMGKAAPRQSLGKNPLLPGLVPVLLGLVAAGAVLWFGVFSSFQQEQRQQLVQTFGSAQASALQQALAALTADTRAAARNPQLLAALQSGDASQISAAEQSIGYWDGVIDAYINPRGEASQDRSRTAPVSFAALDLLRRAEGGQPPAAEAYKVGNRWMVYSAAPLRQDDKSPVVGTLLLVVDLQRLLRTLPPLPNSAGRLQLTQKFGNAPEQVLANFGGEPGTEGEPLALSSGNPNWKLRFAPSQEISALDVSPLMLALAALLAFGGALAGLQMVHGLQQRRLRGDVLHLGQMAQELYNGKTIKTPSLSLPLMDALAQNLARMPTRRRNEAASNAAENGASGSASSSRAVQPVADPNTELVDPLFQSTDILDIDILDEDQDMLGLESMERDTQMSTPQAPTLPASIFRAYDSRGVVGDSLTPETAYWIGRAIGSETLAKGEPNISVGRDGRLSGPELVQQLIQGLLDSGCNVSDIGMVPTPVLYYAANVLAGKSGVMLTGSHNPPDYNGFKIVIAGDTLANEQIQALRLRIENNDLASGTGSVERVDVLERYYNEIRDDIAVAKKLKVVVDCGNGVAGVIAPQLIEGLGCEVIPLFCDVDGNFPNHHPDPGKPENLEDLIAKVKEVGADIGLAFDGDGDRVGVVTNTGTIIYPDRLLMLFAKDVVSRNPGADIIFDVKCTRRLTALISGYGGRPVMWKTGHSLIKKKMKETGALLAGEMSGHVFFKERWFGFDDGIYSAVRLLEIISQDKRDAEHVFSAFPNDVSTPEINIQVTEESKFAIIDALQRDAQWGEANLTTLDGVRVDYQKGWGLVRASNTTPVLVLRFEAETEAELERIKAVFREQLARVAPEMKVPF